MAGTVLNGGYLTLDRSSGERGVVKKVNNSHDFAEQYTKIHFADFDGDGLKDFLVGYGTDTLQLLRNEGTKTGPRFTKAEPLALSEKPASMRPHPYLFDWDGDGARDLLVGTEQGQVRLYRNTGTDAAPVFAEGAALAAGGERIQLGYRVRLDVCDWNNDGVPDLVLGNCYSHTDPKLPRGRETRGNVWLFLGKKKGEEGF